MVFPKHVVRHNFVALNELIKKVLMKAINEESIKRTVIGGREFSKIQLTDNGFRKSKAIKLNKIENNKKWLKYIFEKLFLQPVVFANFPMETTGFYRLARKLRFCSSIFPGKGSFAMRLLLLT